MEQKDLFDKEDLQLFADNLKLIRIKQGLTQAQLAFEAGISRSEIVRIENVQRNVSITIVFAIARALQIPVKDLFDFELTPKGRKT